MKKQIAAFEGRGPADEGRKVLVKLDTDLDEFVCEVTDNGKRRPGIDYFTTDRQDALDTARHMCRLFPEQVPLAARKMWA